MRDVYTTRPAPAPGPGGAAVIPASDGNPARGSVRLRVRLSRPGFDDVVEGPAATPLTKPNLKLTVAACIGVVHHVQPCERLLIPCLVTLGSVRGHRGVSPERATHGALRLDPFERLPASAQTAVGALDFGGRKHGAENGEPAGAIGADDVLGERTCRLLLGACRLPQRRERIELGYGTSRERAGGG